MAIPCRAIIHCDCAHGLQLRATGEWGKILSASISGGPQHSGDHPEVAEAIFPDWRERTAPVNDVWDNALRGDARSHRWN